MKNDFLNEIDQLTNQLNKTDYVSIDSQTKSEILGLVRSKVLELSTKTGLIDTCMRKLDQWMLEDELAPPLVIKTLEVLLKNDTETLGHITGILKQQLVVLQSNTTNNELNVGQTTLPKDNQPKISGDSMNQFKNVKSFLDKIMKSDIKEAEVVKPNKITEE